MFEMRRAVTGRVLISGHRGAKGYAPENTMASFEKAAQLGADVVEFDVHLSRDNRCVIIHDEKLDRTSNGTGLVRDYTWAELQQLDMGSWFDRLNEATLLARETTATPENNQRVPLPIPAEKFAGAKMPCLEEVLEWGKAIKMSLSIELKYPWPFYYGMDFYPDLVERVLDLIAKHGDEDKIMLHSFDHQALLRVKKLNPRLGTAISVGSSIYVNPARLLQEAQAEGFIISGSCLYPQLLEEIHAVGGYVFGWGLGEDPINQAAELCRQVQMGVDFVSGGYPDLLRQVIENCPAPE